MPTIEEARRETDLLAIKLARSTLVRDLLTWMLPYAAKGSIPFNDLHNQLMKEHHAPPA